MKGSEVVVKYLFLNPNDEFNVPENCLEEDSAVIRYLRMNKNNIKTVVVDGVTYLIDIVTLDNVCSFDGCLSCVKCHGEDCCLGVPYSMEEKYFDNISSIVDDVMTQPYFNKDNANFIKKYGWVSIMGDAQDEYATFSDDGLSKTLRNDGSYCVFHSDVNGVSCCALHKYALENGLNPYDFKPPSCFMFPLDAIELDNGKIFLFGFDESTLGFSRWSDDFGNFACVNTALGKTFRKQYGCFKNYKPIYMEQESFIRNLFSDKVYDAILEVMKGVS